jgi:hypothetical protein
VGEPEWWLPRLPKAQRLAAWAAAGRAWRHDGQQVRVTLLEHLPPDVRQEEARRHLALPELAARPAQHRLPYAALLPWEEARRAVDEALRSPDAADRGAAIAALVACTRFEPARLGELLRLLLQRKNEQEPVRRSALESLAALPPGRWRTEHLGDIGRLIDDALEASDTSPGVAAYVERLVMALVPFHPDWAAPQLARLVRNRGSVGLSGIEGRFTDQQAKRLATDLEPVLEAWESRDRPQQLLAAARALGRHLRWFDRLTDSLENALYELQAEWDLDHALGILFEYRRDRLPSLVPAMLARDPSWITRPRIQNYLHARRQDLLTPFLGRRTFAGKFSTGRTKYVLPLRGGFWRWTAAQQAAFAQTLRQVVGDKGRDTLEALSAVRQLAELPDPPPDRLVALAEGKGVKKAVRDTAIKALGRVEGGRGVEALMRALQAGDDRARVAIYALRASLLAMPPGRALAVLRDVSTGGVTVSKEVVRLLGELPGDESFAELMTWHRRDLHRDVRVALLRALWGHLDRPEAWDVLAEAARSPEAALASVPMHIPVQRLTADGQRQLATILADLLGHPDAKLRVETLQRCAFQPISDPEKAMMPALLAALRSEVGVEAAAAGRAVFTTYSGAEAPVVAEAVRKIIPNRRALKTAVDALRDAARAGPSRALPTVRAVLAVIETDPLTATLGVRLAVQALPAAELAAYLRAAAAAGRLHAEALASAVASVRGQSGTPPPRHWEDLEAALASDPDERLRRVAFAALTSAARAAGGWTEAREDRLRAFRQDPSPLVASAAQFTFTSETTPLDLDVWDEWTDLL